jgi:hypothetical protein
VLGRHGQLLVQQGLGREAQQTDAPGLVAQTLGGLLQQLAQGVALEQREGQHRQRPPSATAWAKAALSDTRVIGPCTRG